GALDHVEVGVREIVRIDVQKEELIPAESRAHAFDRAAAAEATELPDQVSLCGHLEHDLRAAKASHHPSCERLVSEDLSRVGHDDRVIIDVHVTVAQARPQGSDSPPALTLLDALRSVGGFANAAIDQALEADLGVVVDLRPSDVDVE